MKAATARAPLPAPDVTLSADDERVWAKLRPDRAAIPVLLYHGLGPRHGFSDSADFDYGVSVADFAKQLTMIRYAGYQTVGLQTFVDFVQGKPVSLPPRPVLLTFDDARGDSWTGADSLLRRLRFSATMFVDVGRVDSGDPEYLTWRELAGIADSGRWNVQLHSGKGHRQIRYGTGPNDYGPRYAYAAPGESFADWRERTRADIEWGQETLARHVPAYRPLAFAVPYGNYGQDGSNDPRIAPDLLGWLGARYDAIFTQDVDARARPGSRQPLGRLQVTRATTGGDLHRALLTGRL